MCNKTLVIERVEQCLAIAEEHYNRSFKMPSIIFTKRGTTAGTANTSRWELNFNMVLLNENVEQFVHRTAAHELAHLINNKVFGNDAVQYNANGRRKRRSSHGRTWKNIMQLFGAPESRCHSYDVSTVKQKRRQSVKYDYKCSVCSGVFPLGATRHKNMVTGKRTYRHCKGSILSYVSVTK